MDKQDIKQALKTAYNALDAKFGGDIAILDISGVSVMADYFMIVSANNPNHLKTLADEAEKKLHEAGLKMRGSEGYGNSKWILHDFGHVIVHLFTKEEREFYNLERIWRDSESVDPNTL